jgi:hypothetical protein
MSLGTEPRQLRKNIKQDTKELYEKYRKFKISSLPTIHEKISQYSKICLSLLLFFF